MSRQNYYAGRRRRERRRVDGQLVAELVKQERRLQPRLGTRKLHAMLKDRLKDCEVYVGRDRMFELLREEGLLLEPRRAAYPRTTHSYHPLPTFKNRVKDLEVTGAHQVWVGDLTYLRTKEGFLYLSLLTDKGSRKIVGYNCGTTLEAEGSIEALEMALADLPRGREPIHHSDRGIQYCSHEYVGRLQERGLGISMTESDHCAENALAERINGILKSEYGLDQEFGSIGSARLAVKQAIGLYNTRRPHTALNYWTPGETHTFAA